METGIIASSCAILAAWIVHFVRMRRNQPAGMDIHRISSSIVQELPDFCHTAGGDPVEPVGVLVVGEAEHLRGILAGQGWFGADAHLPRNTWRAFWALIFDRPYPTGPFTPLFIGGRAQEIAMQKPHQGRGFRYRHHLRAWKLKHTVNGRPAWVICASNETGIRISAQLGFIAHRLDPEIDRERDFVADQLVSGGAKHTGVYRRNEAGSYRTAYGDEYTTDGRIHVLELPDVA